MLWILREIYGVFQAVWGVIDHIWGAVVMVVRFAFRMLSAIPLYFASMPVWILPVITCSFMIAMGLFVLGRR